MKNITEEKMNKIKISKKEAVRLIGSTKGHIFKAVFRKRSDGRLRRIICRLGVKKYITGKGMNYNPKDYKLLTVFDMIKQEYRMISLDSLMLLIIDGKKHLIKGGLYE
jgi:hypothetical protein